MNPKAKKLLVDDIRKDPKSQARMATSDDVVQDFAEAINQGVKLPPIDVFYDGKEYFVGDGWHRLAAHREAGEDFIAVILHKGGLREARLFAAAANQAHGLRRTVADKKQAVRILLKDKEWGKWSSRKIAEHVGVSHTFVDALKKKPTTTSGKTSAKKNPATTSGGGAGQNGQRISKGCSAGGNVATSPPSGGGGLPTLEDFARPYKTATKDLLRIKRDMTTLAEHKKLGGHLRDKITRITTELDEIKATIRQMEPMQECTGCKGKGCAKCQKTGFFTRFYVQAHK